MLTELKIRNFAIIEAIDIYFGPGLNVLTGETGAGKSILLDALNLALGGRSDRDMVRTGSKEGWVEAVFTANEPAVALVKEWGIALEHGESLALRRVIQANGRSRAYINCMTVSVNLVRQISSLLLDFGRQHEQSTLMSPERHRDLLDRYAGSDRDREAVEKAYARVTSLLKEYEDLKRETHARAERKEFLKFQKNAISEVDPQPGEEEQIEQELRRLQNAEKCCRLAQRIEHDLYQSEDAVRDRLAASMKVLKELVELDDSVAHVLNDLQNALIAIEEGARSMQTYQKGVHLNPDRMRKCEERLDELIKLQQRYGGSFENVMKRLKEIEEELKDLADKDARLESLGGLIVEAKSRLYKLATNLSEKRQNAARNLSPRVEKELQCLAMKSARFEVQFSPVEETEGNSILCGDEGEERPVAFWGMENVHFLFSANPGEELRPLERVASGGELSRTMLALKRVMVDAFPVDTFVVDEIDAGVAGSAAATVAEKLREIISESPATSQIISISHTPQIAAEADCHFYVEKITREGRTIAHVRAMDAEQRVVELSRMLAGDGSSEQALALAREMLKKAAAGRDR